MIQRKQSLFLLIALLLTIACLCLPIGFISPKGMGVDLVVNNLSITGSQAEYTGWPLFAILLLTTPVCLATIFLFNNRKLQMKLCMLIVVLFGAWIGYFVVSYLNVFTTLGDFRPNWSAALPIVSAILTVMARSAIKADDELVRSADRIR